MNDHLEGSRFSRRALLKAASSGFGYLAFAGLSTWAGEKAAGPLAPRATHFPARAKRVIFLCMEGGPSHVDTFDYKPRLKTDAGRRFGDGSRGGQLMPSSWKFDRHGQAGRWISALFPEVAGHADDLCVINSMQTDLPNHPQAFAQMHTGAFQFRRPSLGAWTLYGLGTENQDLPGFVTISPPANLGGPVNYGSAFLPAAYQGTRMGFSNRPVPDATIANATNPRNSPAAQRLQLDFLQSINHRALEREPVSPEVEGV